MNKPTSHTTQGFTLIELALAITFLGTLVLLSATIITQTIGIYNKGVVMKQINQAGRSLIEDVTRLSNSGAEIQIADNGRTGFLCVEDSSNEIRSYTWSSVRPGAGTTPPAGGRFTLSGLPVTLVRSNEAVTNGKYCRLPSVDEGILASEVTSLLTSRIRILSVDISTPPVDPANPSDPMRAKLRKVAFWIGTYDATPGSTITPDPTLTPTGTATGWTCRGGDNGTFCAVSKFETIIYTPNTEGW